MKNTIATTILATLMVVISVAASHADEVLLTHSCGTYRLAVTINGSVQKVGILDTGCEDLVVPPDVMEQIQAAGTCTPQRGRSYRLADGRQVSLPRFTVQSVKIGTTELQNVTVIVLPNAPSVLVGQSVLEKLGSVTLDLKRQVLVLNDAH